MADDTRTERTQVSGRVLLAAVLLATCFGVLAGGIGAWVAYRAIGPAQITRQIVTNRSGNPTTVGDLAGSTESSIVTIVTQPTTAASLTASQSVNNGVVISADGLILTSTDAIRGATEIRIGTSDGKGYDGLVVTTDSDSGWVVLRAIGAHNLQAIALETTPPRPGDVAIAVSQPATGGPVANVTSIAAMNLTAGLALNAFGLATSPLADKVGAPVIDGSDRLIGVVSGTAVPSYGEIADFALPDVTAFLGGQQNFSASVFGMTWAYIPPSSAGALTLPAGALVETVTPGSPAAAAGLQPFDVVTKVNGTTVDLAHPLSPAAFGLAAGQTAKMSVNRAGTEVTVVVTVS